MTLLRGRELRRLRRAFFRIPIKVPQQHFICGDNPMQVIRERFVVRWIVQTEAEGKEVSPLRFGQSSNTA
jgi:hypothetical protein